MRIEMFSRARTGHQFRGLQDRREDAQRHDRATLLRQLTAEARRNRMRVDKSALAYAEGGRIRLFSTPDLVKFLTSRGLPRTTHTLNL